MTWPHRALTFLVAVTMTLAMTFLPGGATQARAEEPTPPPTTATDPSTAPSTETATTVPSAAPTTVVSVPEASATQPTTDPRPTAESTPIATASEPAPVASSEPATEPTEAVTTTETVPVANSPPAPSPTTAAAEPAAAPTIAAAVPEATPTISSDRADYPAGATVTLTGTNWQAGETVRLVVNDTYGSSWVRDVLVFADSAGVIGDSFSLPTWFVSDYDVVATGALSGTATTTFTDAPPGIQNLWQCDPTSDTYDPNTYDCADGWVTGNNDGPYTEGQTVPYRTRFQNLVPGNHYSITIQWDTTKGDKHALDYLRTFNATVLNAKPCADLTGLPAGLCGSSSTWPIPADTFMQSHGFSGTQASGSFTMYGASLTGVSGYTTPASYSGDTSTSITLYFTAGTTNDAVLAWGGHIAARANWGLGNSAAAISGSPYHMRILSWFDVSNNATLNVGNTDRSLSSTAVIYPAQITIVKDAVPNGSTSFPFTASPSPLTGFSLTDDGTAANTKVFSDILTFTSYSVSESVPTGWALTGLTCTVQDSGVGLPSTPYSVSSPAVTINLVEGEYITCTFTDTRNASSLTATKTAVPSLTRTYTWGITKSVNTSEAKVPEGSTATFDYTVSVTHDSGTDSAWVVSGDIVVSNPNLYAVSGVSVSDALDPSATCTVTGGSSTIAASGSATFGYTCTYSAAPAAASQTNTATVTWTDFGSGATSTTATASVLWSSATVTLVDESVSVSDSYEGTLGTVTYTDPSPKTFTYSRTESGTAGTCTTYDNTATYTTNDTATTGSASKTVTVCVGKDLTVSKTAAGTFDRGYEWTISKDVDKTTVNIADGSLATFNYSVTVSQTGYTDSGWMLGGTITVSNPNDWEAVTLSGLTDVVDNGGLCTVDPGPYVVPKSGSIDVDYSCSYASASSLSGTNTATATWDKAAVFTPTGTASGNAPFTMIQTGGAHKTVTVTDTLGGSLGSVTATDGAPFATATFTYSHSFAGVGGTCTTYDNTATITETGQSASKTVTVCVGKDLTVSKTAAGTFDRGYEWTISKDVDKTSVSIADGSLATFNYSVTVSQTGYTNSGWVLSGTITVSNPNDWEAVTLTGLTDVVDNGGLCTVDPGPYTVPKSGSISVDYTCAYTSASSLSGTNTATATWDKAAVFTPTGTASGDAAFTMVQTGGAHKTVTVTDTLGGSLGSVTATDGAPFATATFTYSHSFAGVGGTCTTYDNTATITETGQSASKTVTVCVGKDLTVSKTAAGTFDRGYEWTISKDVDKTSVSIADGSLATFNYSVTVSQTGYTDSGWMLGGTITVTNPNDWEAVTLSGLTDVVDNGGTCVLDPGPYVVPKSGSIDVGYTCSYSSASALSGTNTVTATWDKAAAFTPTGTASGDAPFTMIQTGGAHQTVTVSDSLGGSLGSVTATNGLPYASTTFTYSHSFAGVGGTCTTYDNTATITETSQSASKTVTVCVGKDLTVAKTAAGTYDRTYLWDIAKDVDKTTVNVANGTPADINYTVTVTPNGYTDSGWVLSGTITVTNPNDWEDVTLTGLTDAVTHGGICTVVPGTMVVPKSGSTTFAYTCTFASEPASYTLTDTATAVWDKVVAFTPTGAASGTATADLALSGETNKVITVVDDKTNPSSPVTLGTWNWADGAHSFLYSLAFAGAGGTCTTYDNTATITETDQSASQSVTVCVGKDLTVAKSAAGTFDRTYLWSIAKDVDKTTVNIADGSSATFNYSVTVSQTGYTDSGWVLSGSITVTNPNDWEAVTLTGLTDVVDNGGTCVLDPGPYVVPKSGSIDVGYTCSYSSASALSGTNTATATWDKAAAFTPTGTASGNAAFSMIQTGGAHKTVSVTDTYGGALGSLTATDGAPFTSATFTYSRTENGVGGTCTAYDNTATITQTGQSASKTVTVCVGKDLTVAKSAAGTFDRTYLWSIAKDVDKTSVSIADGSLATFNYAVTVTQTGFTDSGWVLSGSITVTNPNDWEAVTLTGLTDVVDNGGTCVLDPGPYVVPKSGSISVGYTCSYSSASALSGTNTATATWDKATAFTPTGTASGTAPFALAQVGATNKTVTVTDSLGGSLGSVTATDGAPFATSTFTYSKSFAGVGGTCTAYDNTATITETSQSASRTVTVCVGKDLTVSKTAAGTYDRTYNWTIAKDVDKTSVVAPVGDTVTFSYTVTVTPNGYTDSGWVLSGKITVNNPNDWEAVTLTGLTDTVTGGTCTVDAGPYTVPKSGSIEVGYTCSFASEPSSYTLTDTATATWNKATAFTPTGTASGIKAATLTLKGETDEVITVVDDKTDSSNPVTLGQATWGPEATSFTYSLNKVSSGLPGECTRYTNTATITETSDSASQTVQVCTPSSLIAPTQTSCQMYRDGTAATQSELMYNVSKGAIGSVAPGVIYFWSTITAPSAEFTVGVTQTNDATPKWKPMDNLDVFLWDTTCTKVHSVTLVSDPGQPVLEVTGATPGATYYFSVKYDTSSLAGIHVNKPYPTVTYSFGTTINGELVLTSPASVAVKPKK